METLLDKMNLIPKVLYFTVALFFYSLHIYRSQFATFTYNIDTGSWALYMAIPQCASFIFGIKAASLNDRYGKQKLILGATIGLATILIIVICQVTEFYLFLILYTVYFSLVSITIPLIDKIVLDYLEKRENSSTNAFGRQKQFVSLGYIATSFIMDKFIVSSWAQGDKKFYDFSLMPVYALVTGGIALVTIFLLVKNLPRRETVPTATKSLLILLQNKEYVFLLLIVLLNGITRASMTNFLSQYFTNHLHFKSDPPTVDSMTGFERMHNGQKMFWLTLASNTPEFIIFIFSPTIISRLGLLWPILISQVFQVIRFIGYIWMDPNDTNRFEYALFLESMKGFNFGLISCSISTLAMKLCPSYLKSTAQIVYNGVFIAVGSVVAGGLFKVIFMQHNSSSDPVGAYKAVFMWDLWLTVFCVVLMLLKYVVVENLLFSKSNLNEKLRMIEEKTNLDDKTEKAFFIVEGSGQSESKPVE